MIIESSLKPHKYALFELPSVLVYIINKRDFLGSIVSIGTEND